MATMRRQPAYRCWKGPGRSFEPSGPRLPPPTRSNSASPARGVNGRRHRRPAGLLGRQAAIPFQRSRTKQLGLLDFEQPPCVAPKLAELRPFPDIRAPAGLDARAVIPVHGVNAGLQPVMLGAQADEGRLSQTPRVEARLKPFSGTLGAFPPSRGEGLDLPFDRAE